MFGGDKGLNHLRREALPELMGQGGCMRLARGVIRFGYVPAMLLGLNAVAIALVARGQFLRLGGHSVRHRRLLFAARRADAAL